MRRLKHRAARISFLICFCLLFLASIALSPAAHADETFFLSASGTRLPSLPAKSGDVRIPIATGDDTVLATHVVFRAQSTNRLLARDANGYAVPWNGRMETLQDTGARPQKGRLEIKLYDQSLKDLTLPLAVWVAYRTPVGLKSGTFLLTDDAP